MIFCKILLGYLIFSVIAIIIMETERTIREGRLFDQIRKDMELERMKKEMLNDQN